jgi:hypothetical protein
MEGAPALEIELAVAEAAWKRAKRMCDEESAQEQQLQQEYNSKRLEFDALKQRYGARRTPRSLTDDFGFRLPEQSCGIANATSVPFHHGCRYRSFTPMQQKIPARDVVAEMGGIPKMSLITMQSP